MMFVWGLWKSPWTDDQMNQSRPLFVTLIQMYNTCLDTLALYRKDFPF